MICLTNDWERAGSDNETLACLWDAVSAGGRTYVRRIPVCRYALGLCFGQIGPVSKHGAVRLLLRQRRTGSF